MKIKVLLVYIVYPLAMATYFKKALQHRDDVDLKVAGPYTGNWIPWLGGYNVPMKYALPPDIALPFPPNIGEINYETIKARLGDWIPDLIIQIDAGLHFKYKPTDGMVVTVATDPHVLNYDLPRSYSDKFFNMQLCYSKDKDIYLPYAYSTYDHFPTDFDTTHAELGGGYYGFGKRIEKDVDAVLIGMPYAQRVQWVDELRKRGVSVIFENGPIFDEARTLYNRGRIGLNWSSMNDLNARSFEIPAMKLFPIMNYVPDMWRFDALHRHALTFQDMGGAVEQVMWAIEHPENVKENAEGAHQKILGQNYDNRVEQILRECKFL